jgi:hypothetical protein
MNIREIPAGKGHRTANFPITNLSNQHLKIHGEHLASSIIICDPDYTLIGGAHYFKRLYTANQILAIYVEYRKNVDATTLQLCCITG